MLAGQGFSLLLQATYFVLLARLLGVGEYGVFAGAFAFVGIVMPYSSLGAGTLFMRYVGSLSDELCYVLGQHTPYNFRRRVFTYCIPVPSGAALHKSGQRVCCLTTRGRKLHF